MSSRNDKKEVKKEHKQGDSSPLSSLYAQSRSLSDKVIGGFLDLESRFNLARTSKQMASTFDIKSEQEKISRLADKENSEEFKKLVELCCTQGWPNILSLCIAALKEKIDRCQALRPSNAYYADEMPLASSENADMLINTLRYYAHLTVMHLRTSALIVLIDNGVPCYVNQLYDSFLTDEQKKEFGITRTTEEMLAARKKMCLLMQEKEIGFDESCVDYWLPSGMPSSYRSRKEAYPSLISGNTIRQTDLLYKLFVYNDKDTFRFLAPLFHEKYLEMLRIMSVESEGHPYVYSKKNIPIFKELIDHLDKQKHLEYSYKNIAFFTHLLTMLPLNPNEDLEFFKKFCSVIKKAYSAVDVKFGIDQEEIEAAQQDILIYFYNLVSKNQMLFAENLKNIFGDLFWMPELPSLERKESKQFDSKEVKKEFKDAKDAKSNVKNFLTEKEEKYCYIQKFIFEFLACLGNESKELESFAKMKQDKLLDSLPKLIDTINQLNANGSQLDNLCSLLLIPNISNKTQITIKDLELLPDRFIYNSALITFVNDAINYLKKYPQTKGSGLLSFFSSAEADGARSLTQWRDKYQDEKKPGMLSTSYYKDFPKGLQELVEKMNRIPALKKGFFKQQHLPDNMTVAILPALAHKALAERELSRQNILSTSSQTSLLQDKPR